MKTCENVSVLRFLTKDNFDFPDFPRKLSKNLGKNSWKCWSFALFNCWQLWFHEKNCRKKFGRKTWENVGSFALLTTLISREKNVKKYIKSCQNWIFGQKFVKQKWFESKQKFTNFPQFSYLLFRGRHEVALIWKSLAENPSFHFCLYFFDVFSFDEQN